MGKTSEAQLRAVKAYQQRNKEKTRIDGYHRTARLFIRTHAMEEDLDELEELIAERREALNCGDK
ncbi:MAG: hypothetical protein PUJ57_02315 [Peptoniphilaceae bacterium]|nr:hypothetical protein [Peptoniphilaceae bacterium]